MEIKRYRVEILERANGCSKTGDMWGILDEDNEQASSTLWENKEDAEEIMELMNQAYLRGVQDIPRPDPAEVERLVQEYGNLRVTDAVNLVTGKGLDKETGDRIVKVKAAILELVGG